MGKIIAKIFSCNRHTYEQFYLKAVKKAYEKDGIKINEDDVSLVIVDLSEGGKRQIQSQRAPSGPHSRTIEVKEDGKVKYLIGVSNTNHDEDVRLERLHTSRKNVYGGDGYHANTYMFQGINKIFSKYFDILEKNPNAKLYFYLLDTHRTYPHNLFNLCSYRVLSTLGFGILNIDEIDFSQYAEYGFIPTDKNAISYSSFNKLMNDRLSISSRNGGNIPAYLKCIEKPIPGDEDCFTVEKYIYTFKALGAQAYDSFITMWCLHELAKKEHKALEFLFSPERFGFHADGTHDNETSSLPGPVLELFKKIGISIDFETSDEILQDAHSEIETFKAHKACNNLRNQTLFRNNIRAKGIPMKCAVCGCDIEVILEAAHLWGVAQIKSESGKVINKLIKTTDLKDLIDNSDDNIFQNDPFYKKYVLVNSGDNGIWLCKNHHKLFDDNKYCFDSIFGKIILKVGSEEEVIASLGGDVDVDNLYLDADILSPKTKLFLVERLKEFNKTIAY